LQSSDPCADLRYLAGRLVAEDQRQLHRQRAVGRRQIGMAYPAGGELHRDLASLGRIDGDLLDDYRPVELPADCRSRLARHPYPRVLSECPRSIYKIDVHPRRLACSSETSSISAVNGSHPPVRNPSTCTTPAPAR